MTIRALERERERERKKKKEREQGLSHGTETVSRWKGREGGRKRRHGGWEKEGMTPYPSPPHTPTFHHHTHTHTHTLV